MNNRVKTLIIWLAALATLALCFCMTIEFLAGALTVISCIGIGIGAARRRLARGLTEYDPSIFTIGFAGIFAALASAARTALPDAISVSEALACLVVYVAGVAACIDLIVGHVMYRAAHREEARRGK